MMYIHATKARFSFCRVLLISLVMPVSLLAQTGKYEITGKIGSFNAPAKIYLVSRKAGVTSSDSSILVNGVFRFSGIVKYPYKARLILERKGTSFQNNRQPDALEIYLEEGKMMVEGKDSISKANISGSKLNDDNVKLKAMLAGAETRLKAVYDEYYAATEEQKKSKEFEADIDKRSEAIEAEKKVLYKKFIAENPNSFVSLDAVKTAGGYTPDVKELEPLFQSLSEGLRNTEPGREVAGNIEKLKSLSVGALAPDFGQTDSLQHIIKLSDFRGKYVLVDFWASWCGPCRGENPNVVKAYNQFKDKNFTILGVSLDKKRESWLKAIKDDHLTWNHVSDLQFWNNEVAKAYLVQSIPQNFLIGPDGKIIAKNLRGEELVAKLKEVLAN